MNETQQRAKKDTAVFYFHSEEFLSSLSLVCHIKKEEHEDQENTVM